MGFCLGGTVAFASACNLDGLSSPVCYGRPHLALRGKTPDERVRELAGMRLSELVKDLS